MVAFEITARIKHDIKRLFINLDMLKYMAWEMIVEFNPLKLNVDRNLNSKFFKIFLSAT